MWAGGNAVDAAFYGFTRMGDIQTSTLLREWAALMTRVNPCRLPGLSEFSFLYKHS